MVFEAPERTEAITVRLSPLEKERLAKFALTEDLRVGQMARRILNEKMSAINTEDQHRLSRDGAH